MHGAGLLTGAVLLMGGGPVLHPGTYNGNPLSAAAGVAALEVVATGEPCRVANDMGLAHIAPAVGTRTVVIFGPTDPITTRPYSYNADILKYDVECSPCMLRDCPIDHRCMTNVTVADAFDRVVAALYPEENEQST